MGVSFGKPIRTFNFDGRRVDLKLRNRYDTYHLSYGDDRNGFTPRITKAEVRDLLEGNRIDEIIGRYLKQRSGY